jgi:putative DNA primase/helicase
VRVNERVREFARRYVQAGLSVVPIKTDGSKAPPPISWKLWQRRRPSPYEIGQFFRNDVGVAILGGAVSGQLEILDFDRASLVDPWIGIVEEKAPGLVARLPRIRTPKGGSHFFYRCDLIEGNEKLAQEPPAIDQATGEPAPNTLIETRGEGGYVVAPGSPPECHPRKIPYEHVSGPPLTEIPRITVEERAILLDAARSFNRWIPEIVDHRQSRFVLDGDRTRPGDDYNARASWQDVLGPAGWTVVQSHGEIVHWRRPGKADRGTSATTGHCGDCLYVFSSNAAPFSPGTGYTKFCAYALINHGGDFSAAATALETAGYGNLEAARTEIAAFTAAAGETSEKSSNGSAAPGADLFTPQVRYNEKAKEKNKRPASEFFDGKKFLPNTLALSVCEGKDIIATPIGTKYKGVFLYTYSDGCYRTDSSGEIERSIREVLGREATPKYVDDAIDMVLRNRKMSYDLLNRHAKTLINVRNGMLNWKTGELLHHDPQYLSTFQINAEYQPDATCPKLDEFLNGIFPADCLALAEEFVGYLLTPDTAFQKAFIAVGSGGNGKGTFLKVIANLIGEGNVSTVDLHSLEKDKFARANTLGKLANIHHDLGSDELKSTSVFKTIVSGDPMTMEEKHKQGFTAKPTARLVFSANEFPKSKDKTNAFFRRLIFVEFPKIYFESKEEVLEYEKELCSIPEFLPALLNRAVAGLRRLHANKRFTILESSKTVSEKYHREVDSAYDFFKECCTTEEWGWIPRRELYDKYAGWCRDEGVEPMGSRNFSASFRKLNGLSESKREGVRGWIGISWLDGAPPVTSRDEVRDFGKEGPQGNDLFRNDF